MGLGETRGDVGGFSRVRVVAGGGLLGGPKKHQILTNFALKSREKGKSVPYFFLSDQRTPRPRAPVNMSSKLARASPNLCLVSLTLGA